MLSEISQTQNDKYACFLSYGESTFKKKQLYVVVHAYNPSYVRG
jgi:hypothetical protein